MKLAPVDHALEVCEQHLARTGTVGTEIESFLTRHVLVLICATFEKEIEKIVLERAANANDPALGSFLRHAVHALFRSLLCSEIAGSLNRFGPDYKARFQERVNGTPAEIAWNNIVQNRHVTAHSAGPNVTFRELVDFYEKGHSILDHFREVCLR